MKVLIVSANNADARHVNTAMSIIKGHGHEIVRWSSSITDRDFDTAIVVPGNHNEDIIDQIWKYYTPNALLDTSEIDIDGNIYIGKGIHSFIKGTRKPTHLMVFPDFESDEDLVHDYRRNYGNKGPAFIVLSDSIIHIEDQSDYRLKYACISIDSFSDLTCRKYHQMAKHAGFPVQENENIKQLEASKDECSDMDTSDMDEDAPDDDSLLLLLLRRAR